MAEPPDSQFGAARSSPCPAPGAAISYLYGVSCTAASSCTAVGSYYNSANVQTTLAEYWDGSMWTIQATSPRAAIGPDAAEQVRQAVLIEIGGLAVVPVGNTREEGRIGRAERAVLIVEPQVRRMPVPRDENIRPAIAVEIANGRAEGPVRRAADARGRRLVGDRHRDRGDRRGRGRRRARRGADTRSGGHRRNRRGRPGGERDRPRRATRLLDERV